MKTNKQLILFSFLLLILQDIAAQSCKEIIGYCPNWQVYARNGIFKASNIKYSDYTILNYCFFKPETTGLISNTDATVDQQLLIGNGSIITLAHNANVKVMVSIGGWTLSDNFPAIAASASKRAAFAGDCNRLLQKYKFDGIDIDWEYPGYTDHSGTAADKVNFTLFMKQIRDSITSLGNRTGKQYKLSACFGANVDRMNSIEWSKIIPILDMINLMTYDFYGDWDNVAKHNSPLYTFPTCATNFNVDGAFNLLINQFSVPASKINIGVAFYGRSQKGATALYQATSGGPDLVTFPGEEGAPAYYSVMANMSKFNYYWDNAAKVPYLLGKSNGSAAGTFVSYDDKKAIGLKASYILSKGARGAIIWDISHDLMETSPGSGIAAGNPLADTLHLVLCGGPTSISDEPVLATTIDLSVSPNPASDFTTIIVNLPNEETYTFSIYDLLGQKLQSKNYHFIKGINKIELPLSTIKNGYYFINIQNETNSISKKLIVNH